MELTDAFEIARQYNPNYVRQRDHLCLDGATHDRAACKYGDSAIYTDFDAKHRDTPERMHARLKAGGPLKP